MTRTGRQAQKGCRLLRQLAIMIVVVPLPLPAQPAPAVGQVYEIRVERRMVQTSSDHGSGNSFDRDGMIQRVVAVRDGGVELEFDLPADATAENRAAVWQLPARVFRPSQGPLRLLNGAELEARVTRWLAAAHWTRDVCGHWIFTWNGFHIDCDPVSVLPGLTAVLWPEALREGAAYRDDTALSPGILRRETGGAIDLVLVTEMAVDPEAIRREEAAEEAAATEIMGDRPELRAFREGRRPRQVSGTVRLRFQGDAAGRQLRRTKVAEVTIERADGVTEHRTVTQTTEWRLVPPPVPDH